MCFSGHQTSVGYYLLHKSIQSEGCPIPRLDTSRLMYSRVARFVSMVSVMNIHGRRIVRLVRIDAPPSGLSGV